MKIVAQQSGPWGDLRYVEDGTGDYPVTIPYPGHKSPHKTFCLVCWSATCRHAELVKAALGR